MSDHEDAAIIAHGYLQDAILQIKFLIDSEEIGGFDEERTYKAICLAVLKVVIPNYLEPAYQQLSDNFDTVNMNEPVPQDAATS